MTTQYLSMLLIVLSVITTGVQAKQGPTADAGPDQMVSMREIVTLNGMGSHDGDGSGAQQLTFFWKYVRSDPPSGGLYMVGPWDMSEPNQPIVTFRAPPVVTTLVFQLTVTDQSGLPAMDEVCVTVIEDVNSAIFVSPKFGRDSQPGTKDLPVQSLKTAIELAGGKTPHWDIYAEAGDYGSGSTLTILNDMSLYGGFSISILSKGQLSWTRTAKKPTYIYGAATAIAVMDAVDPTTIDGLTIVSANGANASAAGQPGENSIGIYAGYGSRGLAITNNDIRAGKGGDGLDGKAGSDGDPCTPSGSPGEDAPNWCLWTLCQSCLESDSDLCNQLASRCSEVLSPTAIAELWTRFYPIDNDDLHTEGGEGALPQSICYEQGGKGGDSYARPGYVPNKEASWPWYFDRHWVCGWGCTDHREGYTDAAPWVPAGIGGAGGYWLYESHPEKVIIGAVLSWIPYVGWVLSWIANGAFEEMGIEAWGLHGEDARNGSYGRIGKPGAGGPGGANEGFITNHNWVGGFGRKGEPGTGGSGGGGGGAGWPMLKRFPDYLPALYLPGGAGGGGGGGGGPAAGGEGGTPGGGSFGIFVRESWSFIRYNRISTIGGGAGGAGGQGGEGGPRGESGRGGVPGCIGDDFLWGGDPEYVNYVMSGRGEMGGPGGEGGSGGGGGGGSGGASCGIYRAQGPIVPVLIAPFISPNTYEIGPAGYGGTGGDISELCGRQLDIFEGGGYEFAQKMVESIENSRGEPGEYGLQGNICPPPGPVPEPNFTEWTPIVPGQATVLEWTIPAGVPAFFAYIGYGGGDVVMSLISPSGRVIDRATRALDVVHLKGETFESYVVTNPEEGQWTFQLFGADVPPEGEEALVTVTLIPPGVPPVADAGPDQTVECSSTAGAEVTLGGSGSSGSGCCGALAYKWKNADGDVVGTTPIVNVRLPVGVYTFELTVDDGQNTGTDTVTITVQDTAPPLIILNGAQTMELMSGRDTYTEPGASAMDMCEGNVAVIIGGDQIDESTPGTYLVTYQATDACGNSAQTTRTVNVVKIELPAKPLDALDHLVNISIKPGGRNPLTGVYLMIVTVTNTSQEDLIAPLMLMVYVVPADSVRLTNYDATNTDGMKVISLSADGDNLIFEPGESMTERLYLENPQGVPFSLDLSLRGRLWSDIYDYDYDLARQICAGPAFGELTGDCRVNLRDFAVLASHWRGDGYSDTTPVPVAQWRLDETSGTVVHDSAGMNHGQVLCKSGTCVPLWWPTGGRVGGALQLNGFGDTISVPKIGESVEFTYALWVKQSFVSPGSAALIDHKDWIPGSVHFELKDGHPNVAINKAIWPNGDLEASDHTLPADQWHHVAVSKSVASLAIYVDGELARYRPLTASDTVILGDGFVGSWSGDRYFGGLLDDVHVYDRSLDNSQIRELMGDGPGGTVLPDPIAHWSFDEPEGQIAHDSAGHHDGMLMGDPAWQVTGGAVMGALMLDGINDYVLTDFVIDPGAGPFTVSTWVKGDTPGQVIISQASGENWLSTDSLHGRLISSLKAPGTLNSQTSITDGRWHHVVLVCDPPYKRALYVDGVRVASDIPKALGSSKQELHIGAGNNLQLGSFWSGLVDDIRIYDNALAEVEVAAIVPETLSDALKALKPMPAPSDLDGSGTIDFSDLAFLSSQWLNCYRLLEEACWDQ